MKRVVHFVEQLFLAQKGRPTALVILLFLMAVNIYSYRDEAIKQPGMLEEVFHQVSKPFRKARRFLFDEYQRIFPRIPQSQPVTIVAIDEESLADIGQWPWPRNRLAELISKINAFQPAAIGLDMYMPEPDQTSPDKVADNLPEFAAFLGESLKALPSHEVVLAEAFSQAPVILGAAGFDHEAYTTSEHLLTKPIKVTGESPLPFVRYFTRVLASLPELQFAASGQAVLSVDLEQGVVRKIPLIMNLSNTLVPGLALEMLRVASGSEAIEVLSDQTGVQSLSVADITVPSQSDGKVWLHFSRFENNLHRYVSANDVMKEKDLTDLFQNKLIMLGLTGAGLNDMRTTALGELVPGIEIQAQLVESIFDGRFLFRPDVMIWSETTAILILGIFLIWYIPKTDSRFARLLVHAPRNLVSTILGLTLNGLVLFAGFMLFHKTGLLFDAAATFIILSSVLASLISSAFIEITRENDQKTAHQHQLELDRAYQKGLLDGQNQKS